MMKDSDINSYSRVKSLSKGSNSRRDLLCSSNLRDSTALLLSSDLLPDGPSFDDNMNDVHEKNSFGWVKQIEKEPSLAFSVDRIPSGRAEGNFAGSVYSDQYKNQMGGHDNANGSPGQKSSRLTNKIVENCEVSALDGKKRTDAAVRSIVFSNFKTNDSHSDDDLNALIKVNNLLKLII